MHFRSWRIFRSGRAPPPELEDHPAVVTSPRGGSGLAVRIMWLDLDRVDNAAHAESRCTRFLQELPAAGRVATA